MSTTSPIGSYSVTIHASDQEHNVEKGSASFDLLVENIVNPCTSEVFTLDPDNVLVDQSLFLGQGTELTWTFETLNLGCTKELVWVKTRCNDIDSGLTDTRGYSCADYQI